MPLYRRKMTCTVCRHLIVELSGKCVNVNQEPADLGENQKMSNSRLSDRQEEVVDEGAAQVIWQRRWGPEP